MKIDIPSPTIEATAERVVGGRKDGAWEPDAWRPVILVRWTDTTDDDIPNTVAVWEGEPLVEDDYGSYAQREALRVAGHHLVEKMRAVLA